MDGIDCLKFANIIIIHNFKLSWRFTHLEYVTLPIEVFMI